MVKQNCADSSGRTNTQNPARRHMLATGLLMLIVLLLAFATAATAAEAQEGSSLDIAVDKTTLYESETLTLTIQGETKLELSLDSLMNLGNLDLPKPDLSELRENFDILDQRQSYSLKSINGDHSAAITWTYQLAPRKAGELTIPSISFNDAKSAPLAVEVKPGSPAQVDSANRPAWVEAETSKTSAYIQEQVILTLRLYYRGSLVGGDLTEPKLPDAIVEPLGEQSQRSELIDGKRYQVVERRYLIYPQRSGELVIAAQQFSGRQRDPVTGALRFLRAQSNPITVEVLAPPADFPGDRWLAAESLVLDESWSRPPETLQVGDSLTRVITVRALGLLKSALPLLEVAYPEQLKAYPEGPRAETQLNAGTVESSQSQTTALVAVKPGRITLPEVQLHWWDTLNNQARVAVIPERSLTIEAAPGSSPTPDPVVPATAETATAADGSTVMAAEPELTSNPFNQWMTVVAIFFALAWLLTLLLWLRRRRSAIPGPTANQRETAGNVVDLETLKQHALAGRMETLQEIPRWAREAFGRPGIRTLKDTRAFFADTELDQAISALEEFHFGGKSRQSAQWQHGPALAGALQRLSKARKSANAAPHALPPFRKLPS